MGGYRNPSELIPFVLPDMIQYGIIIWPLALGAIPPGYHLCDGTAGTPDMRNFTVIGAGDTYAVGATGGSLTHTHTVDQGTHEHELVSGEVVASGNDFDKLSDAVDPAITCSTDNHQDPYKAYAFIQKL